MAEIKIETNAQETLAQMEEDLKAYKQLLSFQMFRALTLIEKEIKVQIKKAGLKRRTGRLMNTWGETKTVTETANGVVGELSSAGVPYARIHEYGGVIRPKNAKNLIFPTYLNQRADGSPKISPKEAFNMPGSFVHNGILFMIKNKGKGKKGKEDLIPLFYLRKEVTIPARPYIAPALAATKETIMKNFGLFIASTFAGKKGS